MRMLLLSLALCVVGLTAPAVQAQDQASVNWALTSDTLVTTVVGEVTGEGVGGEGLQARDYTGTLQDGSEGPLGPFQRWWLGGNEWPVESAPDPTRYLEFAVSPSGSAPFAVDSVSFYMNAGGTGEMRASVFYSTDPTFADFEPLELEIAVSREALGYYSYEFTDLQLAEGESLYVRIFPWLGGGNPSSTRYLLLQDATVGGTTGSAPPEPVNGVYWTLTESDTTSVSGTGENLGGASARASNMNIRNYADDSDPGPGPLGAIQRWWIGQDMEWPDEQAPDPDRYIEFAAGAAEGYVFDVGSISLYLGSHGTGNMMGTLVYSTDPTFATADTLEANIDIPRKTFDLREYDLDVVVPEGDSLYFRVHPWLDGGGSPTKYVLIQAVTIGGEASLPPIEVDGVYWSLTESDTTSVTATGDDVGGAPVRASGLEVRNYADDSDPGPGPLGAIQRWWIGTDMNWPDEQALNPDRYLEFAAAANEDFAFAADSITLWLGSHGTSNMRAALVYSTDPAFATADTLEANLDVPRKTFGYLEYDLDMIVPEGDSLYFRVHPWLDGGGSPTKYVLIQAVTILGEAVPPVASEGTGTQPARSALHASYPNPVQTTATVAYDLAEAGEVEISVYNLLGQRVATLVQERKEPGSHQAGLDVRRLASGVYFVRMQAGSFQQTSKLTVTR